MAGKRVLMEVVSPLLMESVWNDSRMPAKRAEGVFAEIIAHTAPVMSRQVV